MDRPFCVVWLGLSAFGRAVEHPADRSAKCAGAFPAGTFVSEVIPAVDDRFQHVFGSFGCSRFELNLK